MKVKQILYFWHNKRSFSKKDIAILESVHKVDIFYFPYEPKLLTPIVFLRQFFFLLFKTAKADVIIGQFAGYHTVFPVFFARLFKVKSIMILGGTDCFSFPSFNYGNYRKKLLGWASAYSVKNAHKVIAVHQNLVHSENTYYNHPLDPPFQGIEYFCGKIRGDVEIMNYGYDDAIFRNLSPAKKPNSFITVGYQIEGISFYRKGIDLIFEVAPLFPDCTFTLLGCETPEIFKDKPSNIEIIPPVDYTDLPKYYSTHEFYFQLSITEGFPSAICEAMLCECIPIGSDVAAIPDIIGDTGFVVEKKDLDLLVDAIHKAMNSDKKHLAQKARKHIQSNWPKNYRRDRLTKAIEAL